MIPTLIVLSAGQREYREATLTRIARHYRLVLVCPEPATWELAHIAGHTVVSAADPDGFMAAALEFAQSHPVVGVFTYDEWCIGTAARIAEVLSLPHSAVDATQRCRDKWSTRRALHEFGVPSALSELVGSPAEAMAASRRVGFPVIVKPRALSASFAVVRLTDPDGVPAAYAAALAGGPKRPWPHETGVLVEEYLDGPEISVDSVAAGGRVEPLVFTKKVLGYAPSFEEVGHIVARADLITPDPERVAGVVRAAHEALGVDNTLTHTEVRITAEGPRIVEVNGRMGGDLIADLAVLALGRDLALAGADVAAGRPVPRTAVEDCEPAAPVAGVRFLYADRAGVIAGHDVDPEVASASWLHGLEWLLPVGTAVRPKQGWRYFARAGFAVVLADSVEECESRMDAVAAGIAIRMVEEGPTDRAERSCLR